MTHPSPSSGCELRIKTFSSPFPSLNFFSMHQHIRPIPLFISLILFSVFVIFFPFSLFRSGSKGRSIIWEAPRVSEWRPCEWWKDNEGTFEALPAKSNGYIRIDCYGGLNQMRRDVCFVMESGYDFGEIFDVDYFIERTKDYVRVVKELPNDLKLGEPFKVDCSKRKGQFDYAEEVLPSLLQHRYISFTPAMSQSRDRYPLHVKVALCQGCYNALRLTKILEIKAQELLVAIPKPFLSLHLRFEPDMVAYSRCTCPSLSPSSLKSIEIARNSDFIISNKKPLTGPAALQWRSRGKCPLTPTETAFILQSLGIPSNTFIYLDAGDELMEIEGFSSIYKHVYTKSSLLSHVDFDSMHGNTKAALDYYVSISSDAYVATYFGNMDKMVGAMRAAKGLYKTLLLNTRAFANYSTKGLEGEDLARVLWEVHREDFVTGRGSAFPDCFCAFRM